MFNWLASGFGVLSSVLRNFGNGAVIVLQFLWHHLRDFAGASWRTIRAIWTRVLRPLVDHVHQLYQALRAHILRFLAPIHTWLSRVSKALRAIYLHYVKPIFDIIDRARRILDLLRLLHVAWAARLEEWLARFEQKVAGPVTDVFTLVNDLDGRIDQFILDAAHLFRQSTFLNSILRDVGLITSLMIATGLSRIRTRGRRPFEDPPVTLTSAEFAAAFEHGVEGGRRSADSHVASAEDFFDTLSADVEQ